MVNLTKKWWFWVGILILLSIITFSITKVINLSSIGIVKCECSLNNPCIKLYTVNRCAIREGEVCGKCISGGGGSSSGGTTDGGGGKGPSQ